METKRINVEIEKETKKAYLVKSSDGVCGWIQKRWLKEDFTVNAKTFAKAVETFGQIKKVRDEEKSFNEAYHAILNIDRETEKAVAIAAHFDLCDIERDCVKLVWIPKSLIKNNAVQGWFVNKKLDEIVSQNRNCGSMILESIAIEGFRN